MSTSVCRITNEILTLRCCGAQVAGEVSKQPQYQQIVTLRFKTKSAAAEVKALTEWDELVPVGKREVLRHYLPGVKGPPPAGGQ